jgi:hypothetical protein
MCAVNPMARPALLILSLVSASLGCKSGSSEPPPPRYTGPVTVERIVKAIKVADQARETSWDRSITLVEAEAGAPIVSAGDARTWGVVENDTCTYLTIEKSAKRDAIGSRSTQPPIKKADFVDGGGNYADCVKTVQGK